MIYPSTTQEKHYTVQEIAREWALSDWKIRKLFENEPDVLTIGRPLVSRKRKYLTLRIPEHVKERVRRRLAVLRDLGVQALLGLRAKGAQRSRR